MKRKIFAGLAVAGALTLWTSAASLAQGLTAGEAKDQITKCTKITAADFSLAGLSGESLAEAQALVDETVAKAHDLKTEGFQLVDEAQAEFDEAATEADGSSELADAQQELSQELTSIVADICGRATELKNETTKELAALASEQSSTKDNEKDAPEGPEVGRSGD